MKTLKVLGKILRSGGYNVKSVEEVETGLEINAPSTLLNLLRVRQSIRESRTPGFIYTFPLAFDPAPETNGFKITFPLIFE